MFSECLCSGNSGGLLWASSQPAEEETPVQDWRADGQDLAGDRGQGRLDEDEDRVRGEPRPGGPHVDTGTTDGEREQAGQAEVGLQEVRGLAGGGRGVPGQHSLHQDQRGGV